MGEEQERDLEFYKGFLDQVWGYLQTKCRYPKMIALWDRRGDGYYATFGDAVYVAEVMGGKTVQQGPRLYEFPTYRLSSAEMEELKEKLDSKSFGFGLVLMHPLPENVVDLRSWQTRKE